MAVECFKFGCPDLMVPGSSLIFRDSIHNSVGFNGRLADIRDSEFG